VAFRGTKFCLVGFSTHYNWSFRYWAMSATYYRSGKKVKSQVIARLCSSSLEPQGVESAHGSGGQAHNNNAGVLEATYKVTYASAAIATVWMFPRTSSQRLFKCRSASLARRLTSANRSASEARPSQSTGTNHCRRRKFLTAWSGITGHGP
jgi:hypothetical protein